MANGDEETPLTEMIEGDPLAKILTEDETSERYIPPWNFANRGPQEIKTSNGDYALIVQGEGGYFGVILEETLPYEIHTIAGSALVVPGEQGAGIEVILMGRDLTGRTDIKPGERIQEGVSDTYQFKE